MRWRSPSPTSGGSSTTFGRRPWTAATWSLRSASTSCCATTATTGPGLRVCLDAPDDLPRLAPDVEASAYRIALEAVTNARRHSGAALCTVTIRCDEVLTLRVVDDGRGTDAAERAGAGDGHPHGSGVGMASMRARAQAAGGDCIIRSGPSGTTVEAVLPLTASADRVSA